MALFYVPDIAGSWELPEDEAAHALRVLRLTVGSKLEITDGNGNLYVTEVASIVGKPLDAVHILCRSNGKMECPLPVLRFYYRLGRLHVTMLAND